MYEGKNPTALRSKEWFSESFVKLLKKKKYENITIKDIYETAGLSRQTFYNLFSGKEDVLRFYLSTIYKPIIEWIESQENPELDRVMSQFTHTLEEKKDMISLILDNHLELMLVEGTNFVVDKLSETLFHAEQNTTTAMYKRALVSGAIVNAVIFWLKGNMPIPSNELNEIIMTFLGQVYL